jgi:hypothetical protein
MMMQYIMAKTCGREMLLISWQPGEKEREKERESEREVGTESQYSL